MTCRDCGKDRPNHSGGLCNTCYKRENYAASKYVCIQCAVVMKQRPKNEHMSCAPCWKKEIDRRKYEADKPKAMRYFAEWKKKNPTKVKAYAKRHYEANKYKYREKDAMRRAREIQATPSWVDREALKQIYASCPKGYHVDHIIPLNHPDVCGLHVPSNLQVIPAKDNLRKSNKLNG